MTIILPIRLAQLREEAKDLEAKLEELGGEMIQVLSDSAVWQRGDEVMAISDEYGGDWRAAQVQGHRVVSRVYSELLPGVEVAPRLPGGLEAEDRVLLRTPGGVDHSGPQGRAMSVNPGQHTINHLINDHLIAPWQIWGAFEDQHEALHNHPCSHTHDQPEETKP